MNRDQVFSILIHLKSVIMALQQTFFQDFGLLFELFLYCYANFQRLHQLALPSFFLMLGFHTIEVYTINLDSASGRGLILGIQKSA